MKKIFLPFMHLTLLTYAATTHVPKDLFVKYLPENPTILEAGAYYGEDTQWMSELWPKGVIHAFEPHPDHYKGLQELSHKRQNVFSYPLALSNKNGTASFYAAGGASSLLKPTSYFNDVYFHSDLQHPLTVTTILLDEWASSNNVHHIDFMWLDMEGNELNVLKSSVLAQNATLIYIEVNCQTFWENAARYEEVKLFLNQHGFEEIWAEITTGWQGNALYLKHK